ncbi:MAG: helix-turn-helix domain-containing protein [Spirochaetota bacterium]
MNGELLTVDELANRLKLCKQMIYRLTSKNLPKGRRLPYIQIGRVKRFKLEQVIDFLKNQQEIDSEIEK